jgi:hypothetical protein
MDCTMLSVHYLNGSSYFPGKLLSKTLIDRMLQFDRQCLVVIVTRATFSLCTAKRNETRAEQIDIYLSLPSMDEF